MKKKVLIIGSGPIKIGQAAEFDYSGTQASIALQEEGYAAVVLNPNPATIQTDIDFASAVYIQALTVENLENVIKKEKVWGVVPTFGGQAGLNLATQADEAGIFKKYGVCVLGTNMDAIKKGEDREVFRKITQEIGLHVLPSKGVTSVKAAQDFAEKIGFPVIVRAAYTLGGSGSGMANDKKALDSLISEALKLSPIGQALVEKSIFGGKEFEYEIVRDSDGNKLCICTMENLDPMGIHTGDSIVVSPIQTVPDVEVQYMRDASFKIVDALGIQGACNVQFGYDYKSKKYYIIEVNPRLSRSSALASKATGYPIARMAAKIAIGKTLPQLKNPITGKSAFFEPALDYVVVKIPRWPFDKFHQLDKNLGVGMKSTGETMAIGRGFEEAIYKAVESLDFPTNYWGLCDKDSKPQLLEKLSTPTHERLSAIKRALVLKISPTEISKVSNIHPWFINKLESTFTHDFESKVISGYKLVDTCAGEFLAHTPYYYSTFLGGSKNIISKSKKPKVVIVGSGPIRIGQGIEFDYSCVHAVLAAKKMGFE
nr:carbamoyl-phosphate synthase large subunit [Patescibacteria group bacterium]